MKIWCWEISSTGISRSVLKEAVPVLGINLQPEMGIKYLIWHLERWQVILGTQIQENELSLVI